MRLRASNVVLTLLFLLLLGFAHLPHLRADLLALDSRALFEASSSDAAMPVLERLSLRLSRAVLGTPGESAAAYRLENLAWLACAAIALVLFARRLLEPRAGSEQARAASRTAGVLFLLHPLLPSAAASLPARGEILGLALALGAAALFLWGRQEGRYGAIVASLVLSILAGLAAPIALLLPLLLAVCEFFSAHRYRPRSLRLRTSATTFLVFGAAASLGGGIGWFASVPSTDGLRFGQLALRAEETIEELGLLVLPSNPALLGVGGSVLAGALFLVAMQPALVAARSAPRLWGGLLAGGLIAFCGTELLRAGPRASPQRIDLAYSLLPSITVVALGLGLSTTALSGVRRPWIAFVVALGYACLAHANARAWLGAGAEVTRLRDELVAASANAPGARFLVLDPPTASDGVDPLGAGLPWLLPPDADGAFDPLRVRGLGREAFLAFAREPEFAALRREPLVLLVPRDVLEPEASRAGERVALGISAEAPSGNVRAWRDDLVSPQLDLDPFEFGALRASADLEIEGKELERLSWRAPESAPRERGSLTGVVRENGAEREALFDLSRSLAWRLAGRVRLLLFEQGTRLRSIERAELVPDLPRWGEALTPEADGPDWVFERPPDPPGEVAGRVSFALELLRLEELSFQEIPLETEGERLRARGAALFAARGPASVEQGIAWTIDYRIGGLAVARARGRVP